MVARLEADDRLLALQRVLALVDHVLDAFFDLLDLVLHIPVVDLVLDQISDVAGAALGALRRPAAAREETSLA
jgi:hypothetical protein